MSELKGLAGSEWSGKGELWLDPEGNKAVEYDCTAQISDSSFDYTWEFEGESKTGSISLSAPARWSDTFHQPDEVTLKALDAWGLLAGRFEWGPQEDWRWEIVISQRPSGQLVLQMTNITPWGESSRAVRMVFTRS